MSVVSYAQDFHGSFARNATREILRRLFADVTQGVYVRIAPGHPTRSAAVEWLREAGWLSLPPGEIPEGGVQLLLVELGCHDPTDGTRTAGIVTTGRPWVVMAEANGRPIPSLEQHLGMAGYAFTWFDETYRYYLASERADLLEPVFAEPMPLETMMPPYVFSDARIAMTLRCRDCDTVPKVADAGRVVEEAGAGRVQIMHNGIRVIADGYGGPWTNSSDSPVPRPPRATGRAGLPRSCSPAIP